MSLMLLSLLVVRWLGRRSRVNTPVPVEDVSIRPQAHARCVEAMGRAGP